MQVQLAVTDEFLDFRITHLAGVARRKKIVRDLRLEKRDHLRASLLAIFQIDFANALQAWLPKVIEGGALRGCIQQWQFPGFANVGKDRIPRIIVLRGNGIVFMIVAAGASYGQPEHASRNNIDAIVDCFGKALRKLAPKAQIAESGEVAAMLRMLQKISRQLKRDEPVVRHVLI